MGNVFKKFEGKRVRVILNNSMGIFIEKNGCVETEDEWAYLYKKGKEGNEYEVAINTRKNNVVSIEIV